MYGEQIRERHSLTVILDFALVLSQQTDGPNVLIYRTRLCKTQQIADYCVQLNKFQLHIKFDKMYQQLLRCLPCRFDSSKRLHPPYIYGIFHVLPV